MGIWANTWLTILKLEKWYREKGETGETVTSDFFSALPIPQQSHG